MNKGLISRRHVLAGSAAAGLFGLTAPRSDAADKGGEILVLACFD
jgi:hypothetical protein